MLQGWQPRLPAASLAQDWLTSIEIKYYESKVNLNWKNILKSIKEVHKCFNH
jgi:nucleosome binding factor SPN SPT16 subunit